MHRIKICFPESQPPFSYTSQASFFSYFTIIMHMEWNTLQLFQLKEDAGLDMSDSIAKVQQ